MLDDVTMRLILGGVGVVVLALFYFGVHRPTRSSFSGWWTVALVCVSGASVALLFNGGPLQAVTIPVSTCLAAASVTSVWFAGRSLRKRGLPRWLLYVGPAVIFLLTLVQGPGENVEAGAGPLYFFMALMFLGGSAEAWLAWTARRSVPQLMRDGETMVALVVGALAGTVLGGLYLVRTVAYLVGEPEFAGVDLTPGSGLESMTLLICLVAVTFGVSAIAWDQQTSDLRRRATQDDLTGLLGRTEFLLRAERGFGAEGNRRKTARLVVADLDHFKTINDTFGHAAGDQALMTFAAVVKEMLRDGELAGRLGGEEFAAVLLSEDDGGAVARVTALSASYAARSSTLEFPLPTVSYGIATLAVGTPVAEVYDRADIALYRAKAEGRGRAVVDTPELAWHSRHVQGQRVRALDVEVSGDEQP